MVRMPYNSLDDGVKPVCLGKRKNRSKRSVCNASENGQNEGSKKGKSAKADSVVLNASSIEQTQNNELCQSFLTAKSQKMEQSPLGVALLKIGIRIGVDTGAVLNKYIKKRSDKN